MSNIALVASKKYEGVVELQKWLEKEGHQVSVRMLKDLSSGAGYESDDNEKGTLEKGTLDPANLDLAISLGGDGATLHLVEAVADASVPVLAVNYGQLGYLAEVEPQDVRQAVKDFFSGDYHIEERMRISASAPQQKLDKYTRNALNEIYLGKIQSGHTLRFEVAINDKPFLSYEADGMIVSTPTGSTAYSLSAGGPILEPELSAMVLTPVAPHMIFDRSFVLTPETKLEFSVLGGYPAELSMDGFSIGEVKPEESLQITKAAQPAKIVRFGEQYFHKVLKSKFGLKDR